MHTTHTHALMHMYTHVLCLCLSHFSCLFMLMWICDSSMCLLVNMDVQLCVVSWSGCFGDILRSSTVGWDGDSAVYFWSSSWFLQQLYYFTGPLEEHTASPPTAIITLLLSSFCFSFFKTGSYYTACQPQAPRHLPAFASSCGDERSVCAPMPGYLVFDAGWADWR